jgi:hypothetical protein
MTDVIATVGFLWVPAVEIVSALAGVPAAIVILTAVGSCCDHGLSD